jgi:hypothetical protein
MADLNAGSEIVSTDNIEDPSNTVAAQVAALYAPMLRAVVAASPARVGDMNPNGSPKQPYTQFADGARYIVDARTRRFGDVWASYVSWPIDLSHYIIQYESIVSVKDLSTDKSIYNGSCRVFTKRGPKQPTHAQLLENDGAILKQLITEAVGECVAQLKIPSGE